MEEDQEPGVLTERRTGRTVRAAIAAQESASRSLLSRQGPLEHPLVRI